MPRKPFEAVPLPAGTGNPRSPRRARALFVALALAALSALSPIGVPSARSAAHDSEAARFEQCRGSVRINCVVDGDTFWYRGEKIRIADINTPEVGSPGCPREAALGAQATGRLLVLLNEGAFTLAAADRDRDRYGRLLRIVTRDGESLGAVLVREELAEQWSGRRGSWC